MKKLFFIFISCIVLSVNLFGQEHKNVLLISSYNSMFPTFSPQLEGLTTMLHDIDVDIDIEFMDSKRFICDEYKALFYNIIQHKISKVDQYDVVLVADDNALDFAIEYQNELFKNLPIVFLGINDIEKALSQNNNPLITGVTEEILIQDNIDLMIKLFPASDKFYVIVDDTKSSQSIIKSSNKAEINLNGKELIEINTAQLTVEEYIQVLQAIETNAPVLLVSAYFNTCDNPFTFYKVLSILKENVNAPIFHILEHGIGDGLLGGKVMSHQEQGQIAGSIIKDIFSGTPIESIQVKRQDLSYFLFDKLELTKFSITENSLPKDASIINKKVPYFEQNREYVIIYAVLITLLFVIILLLSIINFRRRIANKKLQEKNQQLTTLNAALDIAKSKTEEHEKRFRGYFYDHAAVNLIVDATTGDIYDANKAAANFYGWTVDELKQKTINDLNTLSKEQINQELERARKEGRVHFKFKHYKKDRSINDVEVFTSKIIIDNKTYLHSIIHDINEKAQQEHLLHLLSTSIEQSPVAIFITDKNGIIEYANPAFLTLTGYSFEEINGQNPSFLKSNQNAEDYYEELWSTILAGKKWINEIINKKANGDLFWANVAISPIFINKEATNFIAVYEDITEKKKMIEELISEKNKAEQSNKLKTEFLHNLSHEVRTPLNGIIGFAKLLADDRFSLLEQKEFGSIIIENSYQLLSIIDDILEISRLETQQISVTKKPVNIHELLLKTTSNYLEKSKDKEIELRFKNRDEPNQCIIETDLAKVKRILTNLVENAIKFTEEGSIEIGYVIDDSIIKIYVQDTGIGISKENIDYIFERFVQEEKELSRQFGGIGLGLAISRENAQLIGGDLTVISEKNKGSKFTLSLPYKLIDQNTIESPQIPEKIEASKSNSLVLVAEDENTNYQYVEQLLLKFFKEHVTILHAKNGQEAVEACDNYLVDVVLMDIRMPVMNGFEATKIIKSKFPNLSVIALTAFVTEGDKPDALGKLFDGFVSKPIDENKLVDQIDFALAKKSNA